MFFGADKKWLDFFSRTCKRILAVSENNIFEIFWPKFHLSSSLIFTFCCTKVLKLYQSTLQPASSVTRWGDLLDFGQLFKALTMINLPKSPTFLGNFFNGAKIFKFSSQIIFGQILQTFGDFLLVTLPASSGCK